MKKQAKIITIMPPKVTPEINNWLHCPLPVWAKIRFDRIAVTILGSNTGSLPGAAFNSITHSGAQSKAQNVLFPDMIGFLLIFLTNKRNYKRMTRNKKINVI